MSKTALQTITGEIVDAFISAGIADSGTYTAPGGSAIPCRVFINRDQDVFGEFGGAVRKATTIDLLLSEIPTPKREGIIVADGATFKLVRLAKPADESVATWEVEGS